MYKHNLFVWNISCMCVYLYIHNSYTPYTHIYYVNKTFILDAINHMTAIILILYLVII